jgi:hypothetical protein
MTPQNVLTVASVQENVQVVENALPATYAAPTAYTVGQAVELIQGTWTKGGPRDGYNFYCIYPV